MIEMKNHNDDPYDNVFVILHAIPYLVFMAFLLFFMYVISTGYLNGEKYNPKTFCELKNMTVVSNSFSQAVSCLNSTTHSPQMYSWSEVRTYLEANQ
jgi:hypothetical protein